MLKKLAAVFGSAMLITASMGVTTPVFADDDRPPMSAESAAEVGVLMEPFFATLQGGNAVDAYAALFKGTLLESKTTEVGQLAAQTTFLLQTYGTLSSWEMAKTECATPYVCKAIYVLLMEKGPAAFWVYLYRRPSGVWQPTYVLMGDTPQFFFD